MRDHGVPRLVFSSSAAVYGEPSGRRQLPEARCGKTPSRRRASPTAKPSSMGERMIEAHCRAFGLTGVALRYFNAAGADADGLNSANATTRRPTSSLWRSTPAGARPPADRFWTRLRHARRVLPARLCPRRGPRGGACRGPRSGHVRRPEPFEAFNVGTGRGPFSARGDRRSRSRARRPPCSISSATAGRGDPAYLVADPSKHRNQLWVGQRGARSCRAHRGDRPALGAGSPKFGVAAFATGNSRPRAAPPRACRLDRGFRLPQVAHLNPSSEPEFETSGPRKRDQLLSRTSSTRNSGVNR